MGVRGAKPTPARLKVLAGNPGKRPINNEPKCSEQLAHAPDWMTDDQIELWRYAIHHAPDGVLGTIDREVLASWVVATVCRNDAIKMQNKIDSSSELKLVIKDKATGGIKPSPYINIINKQTEIMLRAAGDLGFTPSARARMTVPKDPRDNKNPFLDL